jgi:iron complex outermembrane recepter protein
MGSKPKKPATGLNSLASGGSRIRLAVAAVLAGAALPHAPPSFADTTRAADAPSESMGLAEIVVTARKVAENLQEVPLSIDVFTAKDMQDLGIGSMDDYLQKVPSISYISTGPGTQLFVMRGVSDGSNPNYANTASTGFFVDDLSMNDGGSQPDLHLYDIERIEVLNGPQGTTFGAGAMSGAIRYITNKPDLHNFSAGVDVDVGHIQSAATNQTYEAFINMPLIDGVLGLRGSAFSVSNGGYVDNQLTTRTWVNGAVSNNAPWAGHDYNHENVKGGRLALKAQISEGWSALFTYGFQQQHTNGAWDEDPTLPKLTVERFGPEQNLFETNMADLHIEGDVGIGDLVFASAFWNQERRQWNEYSAYEENYNAGASNFPPGTPPPPPHTYPSTGYPGTQEGFTCLNDPYYGGGAFTGCKPATQFYSYNVNPKRWSNELRLSSKAGGRFHWLVGGYWQRTDDHNYNNTYYMPGLQPQGKAFQNYLGDYYITQPSLPPGVWYSYTESSHDLETSEFANINFDVTAKLNLEAGVVHFHSYSTYNTPWLSYAYAPNTPSDYSETSNKVDGKAGASYKISNHVMVYADWAQGFRPGGNNTGFTPDCYKNGVSQNYIPDTLNNYELGWKTTSVEGRLLWNGAAYYMSWKELQALIYNAAVCPSSSYNINVGDARIYGMESNVDYKIDEHWALQGSINYTDSRVTSASAPAYDGYVNERLPFAPYFSWSWNARYQRQVSDELKGYVQFDMSDKGDMYNGLNPDDVNTGLPRILQPSYIIMNLRMGINPAGSENWFTEFYVTNLANKNAIIYSNTGNFDLRLTVNEPRVFGARISYRWGRSSPSAGD